MFAAGVVLIGVSLYVVIGLRPGPGKVSRLSTETEVPAALASDSPAGLVGSAVLRDALGIEISSLYLAVGGTRVDLRYKVVDSHKAFQLTNQVYRANLIAANGQSLSLPNTPKGAPIRSESGSQLTGGRIYSYHFPNPNGVVKPGDTVTLQIGNLRAENLVVQ